MGLYVNPGNEGFKNDAGSRIYVDKTGLIEKTNLSVNDTKNCLSLSHARRFGKSQAARMLVAYYSKGCDSRDLFESLGISQIGNWDRYLNKFNVIHLDMATLVGDFKGELITHIKKEVCEDLVKLYPDIDYNQSIAKVLESFYIKSGSKIVVVIDEWDCIIRNFSADRDLVHRYMQFLHDVFKSEAAAKFLALGYITGILPIKKIKDESALNNFREFTMLDSKKMAKYYGFTEDEVKTLCNQYGMDFDSVQKWYDGYLINGLHMYNPNSVYQAMLDESCDSYWKDTSSYEAINTYITMDADGLKDDILAMLAGGAGICHCQDLPK